MSHSETALRRPTASPAQALARLRSVEAEIVSVLSLIDASLEPPVRLRSRWLDGLCAISWVTEAPEGLELTPAGRRALLDAKAGWLRHKPTGAHAG
jgi:hypothetical protein